MIRATLVGNLGKDAEVRQAGDQQVVSFTVATSAYVRKQQLTTWVSCSWFGQRAVKMAGHLMKGRKFVVFGSMYQREHEGKRYLECLVDDVTFAEKKDSSGETNGHTEPSASASASDDIPF